MYDGFRRHWTFGEARLIFPTMLRKLIALLVLVTGLAALGQPAQARAVDVHSAGFVSFSGSVSCAAQAGARATQFAADVQRDGASSRACPKPPKIVVIVPTVMLQADRARE